MTLWPSMRTSRGLSAMSISTLGRLYPWRPRTAKGRGPPPYGLGDLGVGPQHQEYIDAGGDSLGYSGVPALDPPIGQIQPLGQAPGGVPLVREVEDGRFAAGEGQVEAPVDD